ncbi:MAG: hypothetical protein ACFFAN_09840 [Promethearchaeota archaeon]
MINRKILNDIKIKTNTEIQDNNEAIITTLCAIISKFEFALEAIIDFVQELYPTRIDSNTVAGILEIYRRYVHS